MSSSDATPLPIKNQAYRVTFPIFDSTGSLVTGAAALDSEVSKDGGTFADCASEATEIATASGMYFLDLTSTEMNADTVAIIVKTSTSGAKTTPIVLYPAEQTDIPVDVRALGGVVQSATDLKDFADDGYDPATNKVQGVVLTDTLTTYTGNTPQTGDSYAVIDTEIGTLLTNIATILAAVDTEVAAIKAKTDNLPVDPADASDIATSFSSLASTLTTIAAYLDTEIAAILADTNELQTDWADGGRLDLILDGRATPAQVNTEIVDALNVDTYAEPGQEAPPATTTLTKKIGWLYKAFRNRKTQTATVLSVYADNGTTVDAKATISDDGTTYDHSELGTGP